MPTKHIKAEIEILRDSDTRRGIPSRLDLAMDIAAEASTWLVSGRLSREAAAGLVADRLRELAPGQADVLTDAVADVPGWHAYRPSRTTLREEIEKRTRPTGLRSGDCVAEADRIIRALAETLAGHRLTEGLMRIELVRLRFRIGGTSEEAAWAAVLRVRDVATKARGQREVDAAFAALDSDAQKRALAYMRARSQRSAPARRRTAKAAERERAKARKIEAGAHESSPAIFDLPEMTGP